MIYVRLVRSYNKYKARGNLFNRFRCPVDYSHLKFDFDMNSEQIIHRNADIYCLDGFIDLCTSGVLIDYDGFVGEFLIGGRVIWDKVMIPSDFIFWEKRLDELNIENDGRLMVVWYNK